MLQESIIGSDAACGVHVPDASVSDEHCKLQPVMGAWKIVDLESDAGTRVNGKYVNQKPLFGGDVIELGEVRIVFEEDPRGTAPPPVAVPAVSSAPQRGGRRAAPARGAARSAQPSRPAQPARRKAAPQRGAPTARGGGSRRPRDDFDDDFQEERRSSYRRRKKSDAGVTVAMIIGVVVILFGGAWMMMSDDASHNEHVLMKMQSLTSNFEWQKVVDEANTADASEKQYYPRIAKLRDDAQRNLKMDSARGRIGESITAWNAVRLWLQEDNWKNHDAYVRRIDAFLGEFGAVGGASVDLARSERARVTGASGAGEPKGAQDAWARLQTDLKALKSNGQFGTAIEKTTEFRTKWGTQAPILRRDADQLETQLKKDAGKWLAIHISRAQTKLDEGSPYQARKVLEKAAKTIGIPELEERAFEAMRRLLPDE